MSTDHESPLKLYATIFGVLLGLTGLTVAVAYLDLGPLNTLVALGIASTKAILVMFYFMHLKGSDKTIQVFASAGFAWLALFVVIFLADIYTRTPIHLP